MTKFYLSFIALIILLSCGKEKILSKPQLKVIGLSGTQVPVQSDFQITLRLTDKEADFNDTLWIMKTTTKCALSDGTDSTKFRLPELTPRTKNFDKKILVTLYYSTDLQPRCNRNDTVVFSFWIKDQAGNVSDTAKTSPIIIYRL
jgi:hypothetical protein